MAKGDDDRRDDRDDAADENIDELFDDAIDDDAPGDDDDALDEDKSSKRGGGAAVKTRTKPEKERTGGGPFGRLGRFFREVVSELRKVIWPTRKELVTYTAVVVVFVTVVTAIVVGFDYVYAKAVLFVFGNPKA